MLLSAAHTRLTPTDLWPHPDVSGLIMTTQLFQHCSYSDRIWSFKAAGRSVSDGDTTLVGRPVALTKVASVVPVDRGITNS